MLRLTIWALWQVIFNFMKENAMARAVRFKKQWYVILYVSQYSD